MGDADDLWTPFKHLHQQVQAYLTTQETHVASFEALLRKNRQHFSALLTNPPKNEGARKEIQQGALHGITLPTLGPTTLSKDLVDETIILSDMYHLNEFIALELLTTAQQQMPQHPGLPRGLVAILLYYDGRKTLTNALKDLMQARLGISWCTDGVSNEITQLVTTYTDSLVAEGILKKSIDLLKSLDISRELDLLTKNRALGPPKHHRMVLDLFEEIRQNLATTIFNYAAQSGLPKDIVISLIHYLKKCKLSGARGELDEVTTTLMMSLFYALDLSIIHKREDGEEIVRRLPIIHDDSFFDDVMQELLVNDDTSDLSDRWDCPGLRALSIFALGLACGTLRMTPQNLYRNAQQLVEKDEELIDIAIHLKVFDFLNFTFLENPVIFKTEFFYRRLHTLFTDFIEIMHTKVTELRARADETARTVQSYQQQGLEPPNSVDNNFANLLLAIGKFYENDQLNLQLSLEYWGPMEKEPGAFHRTSSRSVCLFKFMRLAGDLLPQTLFIPYLKMLAGISGNPQSARNAFNLLKQGNGTAGSASVSWDHFFSSLARYYQALRSEQHPTTDTIYRSRLFSRAISPAEIAGLQAVLHVITIVATHDEVARIAICEQPSYSPISIMLGLIGCPIVIPLKTNLVLALAALGRSSETAHQIWNSLETSQIICTVPSVSNFGNRGIESELEEIESRNETYPLTKAILDLLYTISCVIVPKNLGAGSRKPGLDPYIVFVIETVFLKFYNRNYKDPQEKWEVAEKCLQICDMFMQIYEPSTKDFPGGMNSNEENPTPGFHIMLQMHTKSEFLRLILHLIDESCVMLDSFAPFSGKKQLESAILYALNIITASLEKQNVFFDTHFASNSSIMMTGCSKLLLDVNPRSGRSDHMLNITKMVTYNAWLPRQSLMGAKILHLIILQPNVNNQLLGILTANERTKLEIRQGFVECLDNDFDLDDESEDLEIAIKEEVFALLRDSLPQSAPNIAHFLLGFDISKDIRQSNLQQAGILDFPSTCSKSLVNMLDQYLDNVKAKRVMSEERLKIIESAYNLLYCLCFNFKTSEVFMRFLRSASDFLCRHVSQLPFAGDGHHVLNQMTALLKSVAIELKMSAEKNQLSHFGNLCKVLLGLGSSVNTYNDTIQVELSHYQHSMLGFEASHSSQNKTKVSKMLCELLNCLQFELKSLDRPKWDHFDNAQMNALFSSCEIYSASSGVKLVNAKRIHAILREELNSVQSTIAAGQRQYILQDIESIMTYALQANQQKLLVNANVKFLEAWSQVTEIIFSIQPQFFFAPETKKNLIVEILEVLLKQVVPAQISQIIPELSNLASSTVLLLLMNLRAASSSLSLSKRNNANETSTLFFGNQTDQSTIISPTKSNSSHLKYIFRNIVEWIIVSGSSGSQKLRMNLYAALLNFIYIIKGDGSEKETSNDEQKDDFYVSRLDRTIMRRKNGYDDDDASSRIEMAIEILQAFGDKLVDILCHDSTGGHDVVKMLALACVNLLLDIDTMTQFINFISTRGYLAHLIDSLLKTDQRLQRILDTKPENMKALYVYEAKMAMLTKFASSHVGAELLLEHRVIGVLSQMKVFDLHPDFQIMDMTDDDISFIPPISLRYQQILFPALSLCEVILMTLGSENQSVITQVTHFLLSHSDIVEIVLRAGTPSMNFGLLKELSALTGLIARTSSQTISDLMDPSGNHDIGAHLYRLQRLMMALFPRFILNNINIKEVQKTYGTVDNEEMEKQKNERTVIFLQVAANIVLYARNCIANHSVDHRTTKVLFSVNSDSISGSESSVSSPDLSIVVAQLKNCVDFYQREKQTYDSLQRQKNNLPTISLDVSVAQQHQFLANKLTAKSEVLKLCCFTIENCVYLLWSHLDYYMLRAITPALQLNGFASMAGDVSSEVRTMRATSEEIAKLKHNLVSVFSETFSKQLLSTQETQANFVDVLLRRIKRLIQFVPVG